MFSLAPQSGERVAKLGEGDERAVVFEYAHERTRQPAPTRVVVDLGALSHNLAAIRERVRVPVMGIVKANAYGHGLVPVAKHLEARGVDRSAWPSSKRASRCAAPAFACRSSCSAAFSARRSREFIRHDLDITVSSLDKLRQVEAAAEASGRKAGVHLKIDTGMERIGVHSYSCGPFVEAAVASRRAR